MANARKPNIIFILTDDLGYGDVNCYGASTNQVQTPRIDQLAAEGIRFTDGHSPSSTCTPSRFSFLTGEYAWRTAGTGIASGVAPLIIKPGNVSVPSMLQAAGYATAVVGKWHLGLGAGGNTDYNNPPIAPGPLEIGFDYYFGLPATGDRVPCVYMENHAIYNYDPADPLLVSYSEKVGDLPTATEHPELLVYYDGGTSHSRTIINGIGRIGWMGGVTNAWWRDEDFADIFVEKASAFIEQNTNRPFFLYLSTHDIHVPRAPHERFQGTSAHGWRGDAIHSMDWTVGAIMDKLDELNLTTNTMVIFTSDNGPVIGDGYNDGPYGEHGSAEANGPFSGGKYSTWEGGTRIPFIVRWPGTVPSNTVSTALITQTDMLASFAALVGQPLPTDAGPDSENILPALLGLSGTGRTLFAQSTTVLRQDDWKYRGGALYDLVADIAESTNLAGSNPSKVSEMAAIVGGIAATPMKSSFLAWWPLNDGNTTNALDRSLNGFEGTPVGDPVSTSQGMAFDGVDDEVVVTNLPSIGNSMVLACWARSSGETWNADGCLISRRPQFAMSPVQATQRIAVDFYSSVGAKQTLEFDPAGLADFNLTNWHHYAASYNDVTGESRLFVDGELQTNAMLVAGSLGYSTGTLAIGSDGGSFFEGDLADVRIYDQVLTDQRMANMASARLLDADTDTMLDDWEVRFRLNPFDASDAWIDTDDDGITNIVEFANNTSPIIPNGSGGAGRLLGYWAFDDASGTTATNLVGSDYAGTLNNAPVWSSGAGRHYLQFTSASQQYVEVPGLPSVDTMVTVACWARSGTPEWNIAGALVSRRPQWGLHPWLNPPEDKRFSFMVNAAYADINLATLPAFNLTEWHHYAGTYDAGTGQAKVYVDGLFAGSTTISPGLLNETTGSVWIGRDSDLERYFEGALDEVRLYNRVLNAAEIMELTEGFDDDEDGMDDSTERAIINDNAVDALVTLADVLPGDDYDGDGSSNSAEAKAGTDATSATDFFRIASIDASGAETPFSIFVEGQKNRTYYLERSVELDGSWDPIYQFGPLAIDRLVELYDETPTNTAAFYKVRVGNTP